MLCDLCPCVLSVVMVHTCVVFVVFVHFLSVGVCLLMYIIITYHERFCQTTSIYNEHDGCVLLTATLHVR